MVLAQRKELIMNNQKERTVFYVQQNQDGNVADLYCLDSAAGAKKWIAKNNIEDAQILKVQTSTNHPEMVNRRFDNPSVDVEFVSEPKIKYEYHLQIQYGNAGWEYSKGIDSENVCHVYNNLSDATKDMEWISSEIDKPTRIKKVGIYS